MFKRKKKAASRKAKESGQPETAETTTSSTAQAKPGEFVLYELRDGKNKGGVRPALVLGEMKAREFGDPTPDQIAAERALMDQERAGLAQPPDYAADAEKAATDDDADANQPQSQDRIAAERVKARLRQREEDQPERTWLLVFLVPSEDFGAAIDINSGKETNLMWVAAEAGEPGEGGKWFPLGTEIPEKDDETEDGKDQYGRRVNKAGEFERYPGEGNRDVVENPSASSGGGAAP